MAQLQHVVIFSTAYLPFLGGAELAIKEITDRIHDLHFICITSRMKRSLPAEERIGNVHVYRVGFGIPLLDKLLSPVLAAIRVWRLEKQHPVHVFWSVMVSYTTLAPVLLQTIGFYRKVPLLLTLQEGDSEQHIARGKFGLIHVAWRFMLRRACHVQCISKYLCDRARAYGHAGNVTLVPNGVDTSKFKVQSAKFKADDKDTKIIITVSRLVEKNGVDVLMEAFAHVLKNIPEAWLHIVGDGPLRKNLEDLSRKLGIADAVKFFGLVPFDDIPTYLARADIFVRPSRSEGLGTAFLEALAMGIPVIGTRVGGIPDFLEHEVTGLFSNTDDAEDLAKQINRLLTDEVLHKKISEYGRSLVENRYTWNAIAEKMKKILMNI